MNEIKTLIDKASKVCGSDSALAIRLGVSQSVISDMRHRGRTITPETAAELAAVAGLDARVAAIEAIVERSKGTRREAAMQEILGKDFAAGEAAGLPISSETGLDISTEGLSNGISQRCASYSKWLSQWLQTDLFSSWPDAHS